MANSTWWTRSSLPLVFVTALGATVACGDDEGDDDGGSSGGKAGSSGAAGKGGSAGTSTAGTGGSGTAGKGGSGGSSAGRGSGGTSGGTSAGTGGSAAGSGGSAGTTAGAGGSGGAVAGSGGSGNAASGGSDAGGQGGEAGEFTGGLGGEAGEFTGGQGGQGEGGEATGGKGGFGGGGGKGGAGSGGGGTGGAGSGGGGTGGAGSGGGGAGSGGTSGGGSGGTGGGSNANLFFSEYVENENNATAYDAIEIFNAGNSPVNLASCSIVLHVNGDAATDTIPLNSVTLADGEVFVLCSNDALGNFCAQEDNDFNITGNDAVELICSGTLMDAIGQIDSDAGNLPTVGWTGIGRSTADQTLRRNCSVTQGDRNRADEFNPGTQWTSGSGVGDITDLGEYDCP